MEECGLRPSSLPPFVLQKAAFAAFLFAVWPNRRRRGYDTCLLKGISFMTESFVDFLVEHADRGDEAFLVRLPAYLDDHYAHTGGS
jgi:hypothetical protein